MATETPRGRVVLITGAAGSIGRQLVRAFESAGDVVVGLDRAVSDGPDGPDGPDSPAASAVIACDITDADQVQAALAETLDRHGRLDVLVHNAGVTAIGAIDDHDLDTHRRVMEVNHFAALGLTLAALPALERSGGRIVVVGSVAGFAPVIGRPAYVASKHALTGTFEALCPELAPRGVGVTLVHPTFVTVGPGEAAERHTGAQRRTTGSAVRPEDVAARVVQATDAGADRVLVGRTARLAWHVNRLAPRTYRALMARSLKGQR